MKRVTVCIAGLFGIAHSPLMPYVGTGIGADYNGPTCLLPYADADELIVIAHSFGVARLFRDAHMLADLPVKIRAFCIDGVQAWNDHESAIGVQPDPLAQFGRPPFYVPPNIIECHSWRRNIGLLESLVPFALSSLFVGATSDTIVTSNMEAMALLGSAFAGPVGQTVAEFIGSQIEHNTIVSAVMPAVLKRIAELDQVA